MPRVRGFVAALVALAAVACSSDSEKPGGAAGASGSGGSGGSGASDSGAIGGSSSGGASAAGGSAGRAPIDVFYASFMPETEVGESPGMLSFHNDTAFTMSFWLGQAVFIAIASGNTVGPALSASAAVELDSTTGKHIGDTCVKFALDKYIGPTELAPGKHHSMTVTFDKTIGWIGTLTEGSGEPFVGVRAKVFDPSADNFHPSVLWLDSARAREGLSWTTYDENRTEYAYAGPGKFEGTLVFRAADDKRYASSEQVALGAAPGYTIVVDAEPRSNAAAVVALPLAP